MDQPPRPVGRPMFDRRVLTLAALQGLSVLAAIVAVYLWSVFSGRSDDTVRSITFATLVHSNLALILVNRSWRLSIWRTVVERRNPTLKWILTFAVGLLALLLTVPGLRNAFNLGPISPLEAIVAVVASGAGVAWFEVFKLVSTASIGAMRPLNGTGTGAP